MKPKKKKYDDTYTNILKDKLIEIHDVQTNNKHIEQFTKLDNKNIITLDCIGYMQENAHDKSKIEDFSMLSRYILRFISNVQWTPTLDKILNIIESKSWFTIKHLKNDDVCVDIYKQLDELYTFYLDNIAEKVDEVKKVFSKTKKKVNFDKSKLSCKFIVTEIVDNITYGRYCNNKCENNNLCKDHLDKKFKECDQMAENTCQHIITQKSRNLDRKGMICGQFTFNSKNNKYCKDHISRHNEEVEENNTCIRSFHVRCYPTRAQQSKLHTYFGCARHSYNGCVEINAEGTFEDLRNSVVTDTSNHKFLEQTPKEIRAFAVKEYITNKNNYEKEYIKKMEKDMYCIITYPNYKGKTIKIPEMTYKLKKDKQCITINKDSVYIENGTIKIYKKSFSDQSLNLINRSKKDKRLQKILNGTLYHDIKIIKTVTNKYYICFTDDVVKKTVNKSEACAVDTGCRTIGTVYSEKQIFELAPNMNTDLGSVLKEREEKFKKYKEAIKTKKYMENSKDYEKAKQTYKLINEKIENKVDDLHYKAIAKLTNEYSTIFIPKLNVKKMLEADTLRSVTKRQLQMERHGTFIRRLLQKSEETGTNTKIVTEINTTKMCSNCFTKNDPGASETYKCSKCKLVIGRDINAAKNIYIQQLAKLITLLLEI